MSSQTIGVQVDVSYVATATVAGDMNDAANTPHTFTQVRADTGWTVGANSLTYTGTADYIEVSFNLYSDPANAGGLARITPVTNLTLNGTTVATATSYQRHASGSNQGDNSATVILTNLTGTDVIQLLPDEGGNQDDVLNVDFGTISAKAVQKVTV